MKKNLVAVALAGVLFTSACGGSAEPQPTEESAVASATVSSSSAAPTSASTPSASPTVSASPSVAQTAEATGEASPVASGAVAGGEDAFGGVTPAGDIPVKLRARTNGTAEISIYQRDASGFYEEQVEAGDWQKEWLVGNNKTFSFQVNASANSSDATEVWCELEYDGKIIAAQHVTAETSDITKAVCGFTGDINTMAVQEPVL